MKEFEFSDENASLYCEEPILEKSILANGKGELCIKKVTAYHEHDPVEKSGSSKQRMASIFRSREYYIKHYSGYRRFEKTLAILSRRIEAWLWRRR